MSAANEIRGRHTVENRKGNVGLNSRSYIIAESSDIIVANYRFVFVVD
jgi:hypothetical protein